eukprot:CAMPEP_0183350954 /NCGR_PEP_ID=MMETSP0164_2-20130417/22363_1 /TAXON_ID=221442 /ORGANISM="Coccolithus pelagicus ssp braarudi, Strain PLY182g" /LENGTH=75 /DNA_ID=CAMNT_0025523009 /DNA_START=27 /DNA_END=254 /DNA_ORIENTATION=+
MESRSLDEIKKDFEKDANDGKLSTHRAHSIMFTADERVEYGFHDFEQDLKATNEKAADADAMTWADVEKFIEDNA